jgi:hypothetical protein
MAIQFRTWYGIETIPRSSTSYTYPDQTNTEPATLRTNIIRTKGASVLVHTKGFVRAANHSSI